MSSWNWYSLNYVQPEYVAKITFPPNCLFFTNVTSLSLGKFQFTSKLLWRPCCNYILCHCSAESHITSFVISPSFQEAPSRYSLRYSLFKSIVLKSCLSRWREEKHVKDYLYLYFLSSLRKKGVVQSVSHILHLHWNLILRI